MGDFVLMLRSLVALERDLLAADQVSQRFVNDEICAALATALDGTHILCNNFDADASLLDSIKTYQHDLASPPIDIRESVMAVRIGMILRAIEHNIGNRKFLYMTADAAKYWDNINLFGDDFLIGFPRQALKEMVEAGNCFATERWTATVFHCMRVAEHGLRKVAKQFKVKIQDNKKTCPVEFANWDKVITAINNKIGEARHQQKGMRREKLLQMYSDTADHCEYMKDLWRNELAHARRQYNRAEALAAINRVRDFVQPLAQHGAKREINKRIRAKKKERNLQTSPLSTLASLLAFPPKTEGRMKTLLTATDPEETP